jgi:hypothetical protein
MAAAARAAFIECVPWLRRSDAHHPKSFQDHRGQMIPSEIISSIQKLSTERRLNFSEAPDDIIRSWMWFLQKFLIVSSTTF